MDSQTVSDYFLPTDKNFRAGTARLFGGSLAALALIVAAVFLLRPQPNFIAAAAALTIPLAIVIGTLSLRQYHRYQRALQGLIDGAIKKQNEASAKQASDALSGAADAKKFIAAIDALTRQISAQSERLDQEFTRIAAALAVVNDRLARVETQTAPRNAR